MLPIKLTIEGLYSYQKRQNIDFSQLTKAGLFGIFGKVGSGKSAILEAMSYAIYGETERMNSKESRAYNMMNLRSNRSYIEFDFQNYENRIFRAVREFKRNPKRFDDVKSSNSIFYEKLNNDWVPMNHTDASKLLGNLSYDNFKRTIIIPQGQFKEFLELGNKDRTQMMKDIFGLEKYDLQEKVSTKVSETKILLAELDGRLGNYENLSLETINQKNKDLKDLKLSFNSEKEKHETLELNFQNLKNLKKDFDELKTKELELQNKEPENHHFIKLEERLNIYESVEKNFKLLLIDQKRLAFEILQNQKRSKEIKTEFDSISETSTKLKNQILFLENDYNNLETSKIKANDLQHISKIIELEIQEQTLLSRISKGEKTISDSEQLEIEIGKNINTQIVEISSLKSKKMDTKILMEVENWYQILNSFQNEVSKYTLEIVTKSKEITKHDDILEQNPEHWNQEFLKTIESYNNEKQNLQNKINHLELSRKLSEFAENIKDGEACPLCGSSNHPEILKSENVTESINKLNSEITHIEKKLDSAKRKISSIEKTLEFKQLLENQKKEIEKQKTEAENKRHLHYNQFNWKEFDKNNPEKFMSQKIEAFELEKQITSKEEKIENNRKALKNQEEQSKRFREAIIEFKNKKIRLETSISDLKKNITQLDYHNFMDQDYLELKNKSEDLSSKNIRIETEYKRLEKEYSEIIPKVASQKTLHNQLLSQTKTLENTEKLITENLDLVLSKSAFENLDDVKAILLQDIDVQKKRKDIQDFKIKYETLKEIIISLENKLKDSKNLETDFEFKEKEFFASQAYIANLKKQLDILENQILNLVKDYEKKKELIDNQNELNLRKSNLDTLSNLFKASGFVQYVSSIYLRQLCDHANIRFQRITKNQLSLQINEKNEFEIIDYLNEGKTRSIKTLSGGQSFQVSLSLALALAESVQSHAIAEKNFFFIDEGFGTQDPESVHLVFETLMNLQKENRIVGIISHVEELKEKIPISLGITKDEETGSQIEIFVS